MPPKKKKKANVRGNKGGCKIGRKGETPKGGCKIGKRDPTKEERKAASDAAFRGARKMKVAEDKAKAAPKKPVKKPTSRPKSAPRNQTGGMPKSKLAAKAGIKAGEKLPFKKKPKKKSEPDEYKRKVKVGTSDRTTRSAPAAKGVMKDKAAKKARIQEKVRALGKKQVEKKKEKKKDFTAAPKKLVSDEKMDRMKRKVGILNRKEVALNKKKARQTANTAKALTKAKPKPKGKQTAGEKLTGLTAAQMNAMSPEKLFGMLPVRVASGVVLNPKRTGTKVAQQTVGEHIASSATKYSNVYYKEELEDRGGYQDHELREALHSGLFYGIGGTTDPNLPPDSTHYDKKKAELAKFGLVTGKRKKLRDGFFNEAYFEERDKGKGIGKSQDVVKGLVDKYFEHYAVKKDKVAARRAEMTKFFSDNLKQAMDSGTMGQSWVDMEYNKIRKKYPKAKIQRTNKFNPKGDYKMNFVVDGRVLSDAEMKEFE